MSPRHSPPTASSSRSSSPYNASARPPAGPANKKSRKREQFSACGACRMRRVRCDLKDLPISSSGQSVSCSNCKERGLKCVDEFAEVKAVKLLRRGRRLQQAEAVYGKVPQDHDALRPVTPPPNTIPLLAPEFFDSAFFWRFQIQRPILEPLEYRERFLLYSKGKTDALEIPGQLIAMALVVWAASFGVNERGVEDPFENPAGTRQRKEQINEMLHEILYLVDLHGILRKASWDGVRLLLLLLPLTQEIQSPMDRLVMHEATLSQVYNLCTLSSASSVNSGQGEYIDALVRARVFWYAHIVEGVTSGLRGGRILLADEDLAAFEASLPTQMDNTPGCAIYAFTYRYLTLPLRISSICRLVHKALTGPQVRVPEMVKEEHLHKAWSNLDRCWQDLDDLRQVGTGDIIEVEDMERFIHGWQIFIFECHNVIREALKKMLVDQSTHEAHLVGNESASRDARGLVSRLHDKSKGRCLGVVQQVVTIIEQNLGSSFFQHDASLVRDGCFYAAFLLAGESGSTHDVDVCLQALHQMRWAFSKSEERMHAVRMIWQSRQQQIQGSQAHPSSGSPVHDAGHASAGDDLSYSRKHPLPPLTMPSLSITTGVASRPSSGPSTGASQDGSWSSSLSTESPSMHAHATPSMAHASPTLDRGHPSYLSSPPQLAAASRAPTGSKAPLLSSPTLLLASPTGHNDRLVQDTRYYYPPFGFSALGETSSSHGPLSVQPSGSSPTLHLPPYHTLTYGSDGTSPFTGASAGHSMPPILPPLPPLHPDDEEGYTDAYY